MTSRPARRSHWRLLVPALAAAAAGGLVALGQTTLVRALDGMLPDSGRINSFNRPGTITILSSDGKVLLKKGPATREKLPAGKMPLLIQRAFVAAEDRRFYQHDGIDLLGISRAVMRNLQQGAVEEGASTITQQLARTVFLSQDRTIVRKLKEAALAGKIERQLSKAQILEQYLNYVYLGSSAYGVSDAAWIYFSKRPDQLTLSEAALIAGLPPAPSVYSPLVNPEVALQRRSIVLQRMREAGFIDDVQLARAEATPLALKPAEPKYFYNPAPWYTSWLEQELPKVLSDEQLEVGGLTIRSGLNAAWQVEAQKTIDSYATGSMEGALVAMEPGTGLVRAMVGGKDWEKTQFNRASQALRSPGSTFKLFIYLTALKQGMKPEDTVVDSARCFGKYCPRNFGNRYMGRVSLATAMQNSLNIVAVALLQKLGYDPVIATAKSLGIQRELGRYLSMAIGSNDQTVLDMTAAYAAMVNRGVYNQPLPFEEIFGPDGVLLWSRRAKGPRGTRAVNSDIADAMVWMLQQVVQSGTGGGAALPDRPVAGKTGTSEGARDLWFIGSIPQLTTGVWLGYDNNKGTGTTSVLATYAWRAFMEPVTRGMPVQKFPPKPVLTGSFKPVRSQKQTQPDARPDDRETRESQRWEPPEQEPSSTSPPTWEPSSERPPADYAPAPAAPAPRPAPSREAATPAAPAPVAPPAPLPPPPPPAIAPPPPPPP
ncbi:MULTISPECIES: transglycosylase domain-containing protein [unclassified Cyanobium]|uniref:transglycosylase domain-containing protein n=1 Tax=unclassified Cyanobium TaxID=2627006 RepID=UPI0020CDC38B|nr:MULTISPECIES: PBP1A family penicillin-binding protein [unclassified Cyanobium]MCP9859772.1 PBP1A family penicillin-binding protein [Cyanobium sp. Cruz-8H5]MCP9866954.1 PBP1A family penicillin-binding protein [Cyanobium sp. Cruz-8D1]